jgi:hypothetical protein
MYMTEISKHHTCGIKILSLICEIDHLEDPGVDGRIILRMIFRKWVVVAWT